MGISELAGRCDDHDNGCMLVLEVPTRYWLAFASYVEDLDSFSRSHCSRYGISFEPFSRPQCEPSQPFLPLVGELSPASWLQLPLLSPERSEPSQQQEPPYLVPSPSLMLLHWQPCGLHWHSSQPLFLQLS